MTAWWSSWVTHRDGTASSSCRPDPLCIFAIDTQTVRATPTVTPEEELTATIARSNQWLKSNLVALGSAAVLAVYAAGYARTRSAAQRWADEGAERRPASPSVIRPAVEAVVAHTEPAGAAPHSPVEVAPTTAVPTRVATPPSTTSSDSSRASKASKTKSQQSAATSAAADAPAPARSTDSTITPTPAAVVAVTPTTPAAPTSATHTDSAAQQADKDHPHYRDGTYTGWGTSRHGDIQASVDIKDGRIADAFISICMTQYSCSWISALPTQVVARQSPDVDFVSGATQSTNAFYYAVVEALKKAK